MPHNKMPKRNVITRTHMLKNAMEIRIPVLLEYQLRQRTAKMTDVKNEMRELLKKNVCLLRTVHPMRFTTEIRAFVCKSYTRTEKRHGLLWFDDGYKKKSSIQLSAAGEAWHAGKKLVKQLVRGGFAPLNRVVYEELEIECISAV